MTKKISCKACGGTGRFYCSTETAQWVVTCDSCGGTGMIEAPMTNADRIRAMTDEELAEWLMVEAREVTQQSVWCHSDCDVDEGCPHQKKCCIKWLQQPCGGADHA